MAHPPRQVPVTTLEAEGGAEVEVIHVPSAAAFEEEEREGEGEGEGGAGGIGEVTYHLPEVGEEMTGVGVGEGEMRRIFVNAFEVKVGGGDVYQYDVSIHPETTWLMRRKIFETWRKMDTPASRDALDACFDGGSVLFAPRRLRLRFGDRVPVAFRVVVGGEGDDGEGGLKPYTLRLALVKTLSLRALQDHVEGVTPLAKILPQLQALDVVLKERPLIDLIANFFNEESITPILESPETHLIPPHPNFTRLSNFLTNLTIQIPPTPPHRRPRKHRIMRLSPATASQAQVKVKHKSGKVERMSLERYFETIVGRKLMYPGLPVVCVGREGKVVVPLEVCEVVGGQRFVGALSLEQMAEVAREAAIGAGDRRDLILRGVR
ncbi:Protein argonaute-2 [Dinochytrium kinnereticum]|nr:Protein argonaute-2 [Dinochytrium kinnereticum]